MGICASEGQVESGLEYQVVLQAASHNALVQGDQASLEAVGAFWVEQGSMDVPLEEMVVVEVVHWQRVFSGRAHPHRSPID